MIDVITARARRTFLTARSGHQLLHQPTIHHRGHRRSNCHVLLLLNDRLDGRNCLRTHMPFLNRSYTENRTVPADQIRETARRYV
jgi:hypothetical protein